MRIARRDGTLQMYVAALLALAIVGLFVVNNRNPTAPALPLGSDPRMHISAGQATASTTEEIVWSLQERVRQAPHDVDAHALLGAAYLQRARETGDPAYYTKAAAVLDTASRLDPQHIEVLIGKGMLALARHQFREALALGEQARALDPHVPRIYAVIGDAQVELGMYDQAVQTIQAMVDLRPDLASYSRVSYVRELHGDVDGAIEAMRMAVEAGGPTVENTQWTRVQLGHLYFNRGDLRSAEQQYRQALAVLPGYAPATAGLARVYAAEGRYDAAIDLYREVVERMPLPEYLIALGDVYAKAGDGEQAQQQYDLVRAIDQLFTSNGVNTDLETALFFADHHLELATALAQARAAYELRPSIHAADALAWTLYQTGNYAEAQHYATEALKLGSQDALKLFHAGMIARALGQDEQAQTYLQGALAINPHFSLLYSELAADTLEELDARSAEGSY